MHDFRRRIKDLALELIEQDQLDMAFRLLKEVRIDQVINGDDEEPPMRPGPIRIVHPDEAGRVARKGLAACADTFKETVPFQPLFCKQSSSD